MDMVNAAWTSEAEMKGTLWLMLYKPEIFRKLGSMSEDELRARLPEILREHVKGWHDDTPKDKST